MLRLLKWAAKWENNPLCIAKTSFFAGSHGIIGEAENCQWNGAPNEGSIRETLERTTIRDGRSSQKPMLMQLYNSFIFPTRHLKTDFSWQKCLWQAPFVFLCGGFSTSTDPSWSSTRCNDDEFWLWENPTLWASPQERPSWKDSLSASTLVGSHCHSGLLANVEASDSEPREAWEHLGFRPKCRCSRSVQKELVWVQMVILDIQFCDVRLSWHPRPAYVRDNVF